MKVLIVAAEATPFVKTGGLADVIGSLPKELRKQGADIRVILPKYKDIPEIYKDQMSLIGRLPVSLGAKNNSCCVEKLEYGDVPFYFIDNGNYFDRKGLYGFWDDGERFAFFSKAVLESLPYLDFKPDIIHCHDWHTAMTNVLLKTQYYEHPFFKDIKSMFTIHNLLYQGMFPKEILELFGLSDDHFTPEGLEFYGKVNYMKGGLLFSDIITTVSKSYATEIQMPYYGEKLEGVLQKRKDVLYGIVNGIDYEEYDPASDKNIFQLYDNKSLENKLVNKTKLQNLLGLETTDEIPLIAIVSRLVTQKGMDLILDVFDSIIASGAQIVILGYGESIYENFFQEKAQAHPETVSANILFDDKLARRIYAGADFFLMPSLFEPCGIGQLISLRYGTIPIVRETGGLKDTIQPYNEYTGMGNGFSFANYNTLDMLNTIKYALSFFHNKTALIKLRRAGMKCDFSWRGSAMEYLRLYNSLADSS